MQLAQAVGQVLKRQRSILKIDAPRQARIVERTVRLNAERCCAARGQVRIDRLGQLQIDRSVRGYIELPLSGEIQGALHAHIRLFAGDMQRVETDFRVAHAGVQAAFALQVHACDGDGQLLNAGLAAHLLAGCASGPARFMVPSRSRLACQSVDVRHLEEPPMLNFEKFSVACVSLSPRSAVCPCAVSSAASSREVMS